MVARTTLAALVLVWMLAAPNRCPSLSAQTREAPANPAEKFYEIFLQRPQTGTALDKTIEHYQSYGQFEQLVERLKTQATEFEVDQPEAAARHWLAAALIVQSQSRWLESIELLKHITDDSLLRWEVGRTRSVALEQLQRWSAVIETLRPIVDKAMTESGQVNAEAVIETAQRLAKAYARDGQTAIALDTWRKLEKRFENDQQIAMRLAHMASTEGELDFAIEVLDRLLMSMPRSLKRAELATQRASLVARKGDEAQAIKDYQTILRELNGDSWLANDVSRRLEELIVAKDGSEALQSFYRNELAQRPSDLKLMLRLATLLDSEKKWDESATLFKKLIERTKSAVEPRLAYAQSLIHQDRWREASIELGRLSYLVPRDNDVRMKWCDALLADTTIELTQRESLVQRIVEHPLESSEPNAEAYLQVAARLESLGQVKRASHWLAQAHALQPQDIGILMQYGRSLLELSQEDDAILLVHNFQQSHLQDKDALTQLAGFLHEIGHNERAIDCLTQACSLGATVAMRNQLSEWLAEADRGVDAIEQLEFAWSSVPSHTDKVGEQEALCEEITRRHLKLASALGKLNEWADRFQATAVSIDAPSMAGMTRESLNGWRYAKFSIAQHRWEDAHRSVDNALKLSPNSSMLWRLKAEIESNAKRPLEAIAAHRKLAEIDVRRRSEYLLLAARETARLGNLPEALKLTESITTETASSQHVIEIFNLAIEYGANKFAIDLLDKRLQARPGDSEVLKRFTDFYLNNGALQPAAQYLWKSLELTRNAQQRESIVYMLIDTHRQLKSLDELEKKLDRFSRQHDLWREFGVWQALISLRVEDYPRATQQLERLTQSLSTRRFGIEQLLKLSKLQNAPTKQFQLMKQLSTIDPQAVVVEDLAESLCTMQQDDRSPLLAQDAINMLRGPQRRLALIHSVLVSADVDMALRLISRLPEQERLSWPIVFRTALATAAFPNRETNTSNHLSDALVQLDKFHEHSLEIPDTLSVPQLLEELLGSQKLIVEFLVTATLHQAYPKDFNKFSDDVLTCTSKLRAYQAAIAAELHVAGSADRRRTIIERHRQSALRQTSPREQAVRLAALAIVANWQSKTSTEQDYTVKRMLLDIAQLQMSLRASSAAKLPSIDSSLSTRLSASSQAYTIFIGELSELAGRGEQLAALLCLHELSIHPQDLLKTDGAALKNADKLLMASAELKAFVPAQIITLMTVARINSKSKQPTDYFESLSQMSLSRQEQQQLVKLALIQGDPETVNGVLRALLTAKAAGVLVGDLLGELICNRANADAISAPNCLMALDALWTAEVGQGLRSLKTFDLSHSSTSSPWAQSLPHCSLPMHESSLFQRTDFDVLRAILAQSPSNAGRQAILKQLKELSEMPAVDDLRLVRQLARIFALKLLEQGTQSAILIDEVMNDRDLTDPNRVVLRAMWLDITGQRDASIACFLKLDSLPMHLNEKPAVLLLNLGMERHDYPAVKLAVQYLRASTKDLADYRNTVTELIHRNQLELAEQLIGEFNVVLPPTNDLHRPVASLKQSMDQSLANALGGEGPAIIRWSQTDQLFALLHKVVHAGKKEAALRIARRLLSGAIHASDESLRENSIHLAILLESAFIDLKMLHEFMEKESARFGNTGLTEPQERREAVCVLSLIGRSGHADLAQPIIQRLTEGNTTALEHLEIAKCELALGDNLNAAHNFGKAFQERPEWLEGTIKTISTNPEVVKRLAEQLNKNSNPGAGVGVASMQEFLNHIPIGKLQDISHLVVGWSSNALPKTLSQIRTVLTRARNENFDLWLNILEQLLIADELHPIDIAFDNAGSSVQLGLSARGNLELHLTEFDLPHAEKVGYVTMLQRVVEQSHSPFISRLLLAHGALNIDQLELAEQQLTPLLHTAIALSPMKDWALKEWSDDIAKYLADRKARQSNAASLTTLVTNSVPIPIANQSLRENVDKSAKIRLLSHLLGKWPMENAKSSRFQLLQGVVALGGLNSLSPLHQEELINDYADKGDTAKILSTFETFVKDLSPTSTDRNVKVNALAQSALNILAAHGMNWERHLILVRAAQRERVPLNKSSYYLSQLSGGTADQMHRLGALTYPLTAPEESMIEQFIADASQNSPGFWSEAFQPCLVLNKETQKLESVSMLDAIWPHDVRLVDDQIHARVRAKVHQWSKDLDTLSPWQTLANHNLAARLGEFELVKQTQQRLLMLGKTDASVRSPWKLSCWSAVIASETIPDDVQRFQLGELARTVAAENRVSENVLYMLMTAYQLDRCFSGEDVPGESQELLDKTSKEVESLVTGSIRGLTTTVSLDATQFQIHMLMFEKLLSRGQVHLAVEMIRTVNANQMVYADAQGINSYELPIRNERYRERQARILAICQQLIDTQTETVSLQRLWEELLLEPVKSRRFAVGSASWIVSDSDSSIAQDFPDLAHRETDERLAQSADTQELPALPLDNGMLAEQTLSTNMFSQLIQMARINDSLPQLHQALIKLPSDSTSRQICGTLLALEEQKLPKALDSYRALSANVQKRKATLSDLALVRQALYNVVRLDPLSDIALDYADIALQHPMDQSTTNLLRQQFVLAAQLENRHAVKRLVAALLNAEQSQIKPPTQLRMDLAITLLEAGAIKSSLDTYGRFPVSATLTPEQPDRFVMELMKKAPLLPLQNQAELFECFVSRSHMRFPWLVCYPMPAMQTLPARFRNKAEGESLILQSLDRQQSWVSLLSWIADYAQRTQRTNAAIEAAAFTAVSNTDAVWGAAALTAQLNPSLTTGALRNRLESATHNASPAAMRALLDCCQGNEALRAGAVEIILNMGYLQIALASPLNAADAKRNWKHWITVRETTLSNAEPERPRWTLGKEGLWTAQPTNDVWYLMLPYPIRGDFEISLVAQQTSGNKFGVGCNGIALVQQDSDREILCLGVGQRRAPKLVAVATDPTDVPLRIQRKETTQTISALAEHQEQTDGATSLIYLVNQGAGAARMNNWQLANDLQIAREMNLIDSQMRLWRTTIGNWKLPSLTPRLPGISTSSTPSGCSVSDGVLLLNASSNVTASPNKSLTESIHCLRPLQAGESVSYEFYHAIDMAPVHPTIGPVVIRLDETEPRLQWLIREEQQNWLGVATTDRFALEPNEKRGPAQLNANAWNKVRLTLTVENQIVLELNELTIAQVGLPRDVQLEFGLTVTQPLPAKVRGMTLTGPWPESLTPEQLMK